MAEIAENLQYRLQPEEVQFLTYLINNCSKCTSLKTED